MLNIFRNFILLLTISVASVNASDRSPDLLIEDLIAGHYEVLDSLTLEELGFIKSYLALLMDTFSGGRLTHDMLNYFVNNLGATRHFLHAYHLAEELSREACGLSEDSERHSLDEVDAVRHFIWSSYLTFYLGEKISREILSLQEDRELLENSSKMDLYNNERGIEFANFIQEKIEKDDNQMSYSFDDRTQQQYALEYLRDGLLKVIESKESGCSTPDKYPNFQDNTIVSSDTISLE